MIAALLLSGAGIGALLWVGASALHDGERAAGRPLRWIWAATIAGIVLLTVALPLRARSFRTITDSGTASTALLAGVAPVRAAPSSWRGMLDRVATGVSFPVQRAGTVIARASAATPPALDVAVGAAWATASLSCLLLLLATYRRTHRMRARWPARMVLDTPVRISDDAGPAVIGVAPMEIVVPSWILTREPADQRLVLAHELEHVRAHDPWLLVAGCAAVAIMPWNPFLWLALSRLRLAVELDCDRRVLRGGATPARYGRLLLDLSEHRSSLASALPALSYSASHLERRLLAMTSRRNRFTGARRAGGILLTTAALLAACESRLPTSAEIDAMDAKSATRAAALTGADTTVIGYVVDGQRVTQEQAMRVASDSILTLDVLKPTTAGGETQVRLRTSRHRDTVALLASQTALVDSMRADSVPSSRSKVRQSTTADSVPFAMSRLRRTAAANDSAAPTRVPLMRSKTAFTGLFVIDGQIVSGAAANALTPDRIESIEVVKGNAAKLRYDDPRAADGVILITTKKR